MVAISTIQKWVTHAESIGYQCESAEDKIRGHQIYFYPPDPANCRVVVYRYYKNDKTYTSIRKEELGIFSVQTSEIAVKDVKNVLDQIVQNPDN
jgi:hypothetical protein